MSPAIGMLGNLDAMTGAEIDQHIVEKQESVLSNSL